MCLQSCAMTLHTQSKYSVAISKAKHLPMFAYISCLVAYWCNRYCNWKCNESIIKNRTIRDSAHLSAQNALVFVYRLHLSKANTFFRKYTCFSLSHSLWLRISCSPQSSYVADTQTHTYTHRIAPLLYTGKSVWDWSASTTDWTMFKIYMFVQLVHRCRFCMRSLFFRGDKCMRTNELWVYHDT